MGACHRDDQVITQAAVSHNRIGSHPRTVSDAVYLGSTVGNDFVYTCANSPVSTTTQAVTTTTASTTQASTTTQAGAYWKICDEEDESKQCPNDSNACWNNLQVMCGWDGGNGSSNWNICDEPNESKQCPNDSNACWNNLTAQCGW